MKLAVGLACACAACGGKPATSADATPLADAPAPLPAPIGPGDFPRALDEAFIRAPQTWIDDAGFAVKWQAMLAAPIEYLGGADSAFHADLAQRSAALPGGEVLCHGDPKLDNFGWVLAVGPTGYSDVDFDDAGACPAAADVLHFLVATELQFGDPARDSAALDAYIATLADDSAAVAIDTSWAPAWDTVRSDGVDKATGASTFHHGGEIEAPASDELAAVTALHDADARFPTTLLDVARDVKTTGGSAGLRRFWLLVEDASHPRTIIELKELATPGTELGPHSTTYDGDTRFDTLKPFWWQAAAPRDHFAVTLLGSRFVARDRFGHVVADATKLTATQIDNALLAEASLVARRHRTAWAGIDPIALRAWLAASAQTLAARWRASYLAAGGS